MSVFQVDIASDLSWRFWNSYDRLQSRCGIYRDQLTDISQSDQTDDSVGA